MRIRRFLSLAVLAVMLGAATTGPGARVTAGVRLHAHPSAAVASVFEALSTNLVAAGARLESTRNRLDDIGRRAAELQGAVAVSRGRLTRTEAVVARILGAPASPPQPSGVAAGTSSGESADGEGPAAQTPTPQATPTEAASVPTAATVAPSEEQADRAYDRLAVAVRAFQAVVSSTHRELRALQRQARAVWRGLDREARTVQATVALIRSTRAAAGVASTEEQRATGDGGHALATISNLRAEVRRVQFDLALQRSQLGRQERGADDRLATALSKEWVPVGPPSLGGDPFALCPVDPPRSFTDDFGAPRWGGGFHLHQGNDILAPYGTPIRAPFDGRAESTANSLGGLAVTIYGSDGFAYNAHLSSYGTLGQVSAGTIIGYVGNSGDAAGGPPHDHFEWHPGGGPAIDPYPFLIAVC